MTSRIFCFLGSASRRCRKRAQSDNGNNGQPQHLENPLIIYFLPFLFDLQPISALR
jgi:hypothetical protein